MARRESIWKNAQGEDLEVDPALEMWYVLYFVHSLYRLSCYMLCSRRQDSDYGDTEIEDEGSRTETG